MPSFGREIAHTLLGRVALSCTYVILVTGIFSLGSAPPEIHHAFMGQPDASRNTQLAGAAAGFGFAERLLGVYVAEIVTASETVAALESAGSRQAD